MTRILIDLDDSGGPAVGSVKVTSHPDRVTGADGSLIRPGPQYHSLRVGQVVLDLQPPGPGWCWRIDERIRGGRTRYITFADTPELLAYSGPQVHDVDPVGLGPGADPGLPWVIALQALADRFNQAPPGSAPTGFEYHQTTPAATWSIPVPGFGRRPNVALYVAGEHVETDVVATHLQVVVTWPSPMAGTAVLT